MTKYTAANIRLHTPIPNETLVKLDFTLPNLMQDLALRIAQLRQKDFDYSYVSEGNETLVKDHTQRMHVSLNPIHPKEAVIQALRYVRGMILIRNYCTDIRNKTALFKQLPAIYNNYLRYSLSPYLSNTVYATHTLAEQFAQLLHHQFKIDLDKARTQVTMSRDLGLLLESHPDIMTISPIVTGENSNPLVAVEVARQYQISARFYAEEFEHCAQKKWYRNALKLAGFNEHTKDNWLANFFLRKETCEALKAYSVPALSSARWLPMPANNQRMIIFRAEQLADGGLKKLGVHSHFIRTAVPVAFDIENIHEQERLAVQQLKELIRNDLANSLQDYKALYGNFAECDATGNYRFFTAYLTFLTPHHFEAHLYFLNNDNNAKFMEMIQRALPESINQLAEEFLQQHKNLQAKVCSAETNSAVNNKSGWLTAKEFDSEKIIREEKLLATSILLKRVADELVASSAFKADLYCLAQQIRGEVDIFYQDQEKMERIARMFEQGRLLAQDGNVISPKLQAELAQRLRGAFYLRQLMNNQFYFHDLTLSQHNIFLSALEFLALGSQALTLAGCKSARDRTAIFLCAVKTMLMDVKAMYDWNTLNAGIVSSLYQGHAFRSMSHHNAIVKIADANQYFMSQLKDLAEPIKLLRVFGRKLTTPLLKSSLPTSVLFFKIPEKKTATKPQDKKDELKPLFF